MLRQRIVPGIDAIVLDEFQGLRLVHGLQIDLHRQYFRAGKAVSTTAGMGYMEASPTWIEPSRYTVAVGEVAFHISSFLALAAGGGAFWARAGTATARAIRHVRIRTARTQIGFNINPLLKGI